MAYLPNSSLSPTSPTSRTENRGVVEKQRHDEIEEKVKRQRNNENDENEEVVTWR